MGDWGTTRLRLFRRGVDDKVEQLAGAGIGQLWAVGGAEASNLAEWLDAGAEGIGVGGSLYRPGDDAASVGRRAKALVETWETYVQLKLRDDQGVK